MFSTSYLEISKSGLVRNLEFVRNMLGDKVLHSCVVKGNAYGHGIESFVPLAENCGVEHFSVFDANEAFKVNKVCITNPTIMIMGMIDEPELEWAIDNDIHFFVFTLDRLKAALETARRMKKKARIHIEVETGMNRTGFSEDTLPDVASLLEEYDSWTFEGLCTHYAGAESIANYYRIKTQLKVFNQRHLWFTKNGFRPKMRHTACSAAAVSYPSTRMDMARIGIMQYGFWPSMESYIHYVRDKEDKRDPLERLISWKSKVMSVKHIKLGEFIGYGTSFLAHRPMIIATVPVGYSYGFSRSLSNQGRVLIRGHRLMVIGMVNMNMLMVDVTDAPEVQVGDEVVLIGSQGDITISVSSFGQLSDMLNYELLTRLPESIPRFLTY